MYWRVRPVRGAAGAAGGGRSCVDGRVRPARAAAYDLAGRLAGAVEDGFVLVDLVYGEAHRGVDLALAHDLDAHRHPPLLAGPRRPAEGFLYLVRLTDPA